ncbi:MAG TPA: aldose epimerase family protein [Polyangiaceae bacterium]|nr:aldose epimerase family protein [Polyangiaceae bacterium]
MNMSGIERSEFGELSGRAVDLYTLTNSRGLVLKVTNYGATLTELHVPDRNGQLADVVLGFERVDGYAQHGAFFGATVGRVANRIRAARFELDGRVYPLAATDGADHLHGGRRGWDRALWSAQPERTPDGPSLLLSSTSADGEEGYPGRVNASVRYTLTEQNEVNIEMRAETDRTTIINMAHHSYWNLGGHGSGDVLEHELALHADAYTPGDPVVPTGEVRAVAGTPFDFRRPKPIGRDLDQVGTEPRGFDHNWVVNGTPSELRPVARVYHPRSGRVLELHADTPGVQFYSGNFLDGSLIGKGQRYQRHAGLCLETQAFPNAINLPEWRDQVIRRAGQSYRQRMVHRFSLA